MKAIRFKTMAVLLVGMALVVAACEPKPKTKNGGINGWGGLSETEKLVKRHIDELANVTDWADAQVKYAKNMIAIDSVIKRSNLKGDMKTLNNKNYCHSMDTIMQIIMGKSDCANYHGKKKNGELYAIHAERAKYSDINSPIHTQVEQAYKNHEDMLSFIGNAGVGQNVTSWSTPYDEKTENNKKRETQNYLNTNPTCKQIIDGLNNIKSGAAFKGRRKNYCEKILELYLQKDTWTLGEEKKLKGLLNSTYGSIIDEWQNKIDTFREEKNKQNQ